MCPCSELTSEIMNHTDNNWYDFSDRGSANRKASTCTGQDKHTQTHIHASSEIQTHDPSVRATEDSTHFRPHGRCDRSSIDLKIEIWRSGVH
jgi:hypothetical protein